MKTPFLKKFLLAACLLIGACLPNLSAHVHLEAGAIDSNSSGSINTGDKLAMYQSDDSFPALYSGYTLVLSYSGTGTYAGSYNAGLTFTALSTNELAGGSSTYSDIAPLTGSYIEMRLVSVTRVGGGAGSFSFWEAGAIAPTFSLASGATPTGVEQFNLTQGISDPFGHIHGRRYSVDTPGTYEVVFQLIDTSTSPIHADSDPFTLTVTAIPEPSAIGLIALAGLALSWRRRSRLQA